MLSFNSCEKKIVAPCARVVLVATVGNCYLIVQVLGNPIGKKYTANPPNGVGPNPLTFSNAVFTSLTIKANYGDTIYFRYKMPMDAIDCSHGGPTTGLFVPPDIPSVKILSYSQKNCAQ